MFIPNDPNDPEFELSQLSLPAGISVARMQNRRALQKLINRQAVRLDKSAVTQGLNSYYEKALAMLNSPKVRRAFDLASEEPKVRDAYGRTTYGQGCLLARRLVESGVKFVTVYFAKSIGGQSTTNGGWDTHGFNDTRMYEILPKWHYPLTDHTVPVLINDLKDRGLLEDTLILWMGEFGRTPKINKNISRDHWPRCYTVLLAGGGVAGGAVLGKSDRYGSAPEQDPVTPGDVASTLYDLLGIDPATEIRDHLNRPFPIGAGHPIREIYD